MPADAPDELFQIFRHEAGTPLAVVGGALRALERTQLSAEQKKLLESAVRQWEVLQRLLDQLAVADDEPLRLERGPVDVGALAREIVDDLADTILAGHSCEVHVGAGAVTVQGDRIRLRQVLFNLLDNAAKYSPDDTAVHVTVDRDGSDVVITVTDEGSGITTPDLVRIFDRYERASDDVQGLGLGLYVVWRVVEAHGGEVSAAPVPDGPGARFVVRLPGAGRPLG